MAQKGSLFSWIYFTSKNAVAKSLPYTAMTVFLLGAVLFLYPPNAQAQEASPQGTTPEAASANSTDKSNIEAVLREPMAGAGPQNMLVTPGQVHWSLEKQPSSDEVVVKGSLDFPDINFHLDIVFRRNLSPDLAASHIFLLTFTDKSAQPSRNVKDFAGIELRVSPATAGKYLKGLSIPLEPGSYAIALFKTDFDIKSNIEIILEYNWFTFPVMFSNGRTGYMTFTKGVEGEKIFREAIALWNTKKEK